MELLLCLAIDLVMIFLAHFTLSKAMAGMLLRNQRLKSRGANTVILRGLSGKMTVNALLIGAPATLLVFAMAMCNVAFGEKIYEDCSLSKECPYDVMVMFDLSKEHDLSMEEGRQIVETYSPISAELDYQLCSAGETTLCSSILGYKEMG